jgi:hypothetical protein
VEEKGSAVSHLKDGTGSMSGVDSQVEVAVGRENLSHALPPHESYEGRHRWDPAFEWDEAEEKKVVRKTDLFLLSWLCVMFVSAKQSCHYSTASPRQIRRRD